jgi:N-terminal acetyltransferase B complex non-catalytic subunit
MSVVTGKLTGPERAFVDCATLLADWLEPYHDHVRPPPSAVLAEATKQGELKPGHPLKKADGPANGHAQSTAVEVKEKEKELPVVVEPPAEIDQFFDCTSIRTPAVGYTYSGLQP